MLRERNNTKAIPIFFVKRGITLRVLCQSWNVSFFLMINVSSLIDDLINLNIEIVAVDNIDNSIVDHSNDCRLKKS